MENIALLRIFLTSQTRQSRLVRAADDLIGNFWKRATKNVVVVKKTSQYDVYSLGGLIHTKYNSDLKGDKVLVF